MCVASIMGAYEFDGEVGDPYSDDWEFFITDIRVGPPNGATREIQLDVAALIFNAPVETRRMFYKVSAE